MARVAVAACVERVEADVVGVGKRGLLARDRAHAHAAVDGERARLDDAFLEAPALEPRVLEVKIGKVDVADMDVGEHLRELAHLERRGLEEQMGGLLEQRRVDGGNREIGHGGPSQVLAPAGLTGASAPC